MRSVRPWHIEQIQMLHVHHTLAYLCVYFICIEDMRMYHLNKHQAVMNEKRILMRLQHPNIIRLHSTFQDEYCLYFVLELAEKGELYDYIANMGAFPLPVARFYIAGT